MNWPLDVVLDYIASVIWPFCRIGAMFMAMSLFGTQNVPRRVRLMLALTTTVAVRGMLPAMPDVPLFSVAGMLITAQQVLIGVVVGFITQIFMAAFILAGQVVGMQTSLGFASMVDPVNGQSVPVVAQFFLILSILLFLAFDGHLAMIRLIVMSFHTLPVGETLNVLTLRHVAEWAQWIFTTALAMTMSALIALLLINFSFGIMSRAAPQLNVFALGFPITMVSGLVIIWLTIGTVLTHFEQHWDRTLSLVCDVIGTSC